MDIRTDPQKSQEFCNVEVIGVVLSCVDIFQQFKIILIMIIMLLCLILSIELLLLYYFHVVLDVFGLILLLLLLLFLQGDMVSGFKEAPEK